MCGDEQAQCGTGVQCGESFVNSVVAHQWMQKGVFSDSGVSTTPRYARAVRYALGEEHRTGKVITFDTAILVQQGVQIYRVKAIVPHPAVPEDDEYVLVARNCGAIPSEAVLSVRDVP
jgi:hypothetical protein